MDAPKHAYPRDDKPWGDKEDAYLQASLTEGLSINEINVRLKRNPSSIVTRIEHLKCPDMSVSNLQPKPAPSSAPLQTWDDKVAAGAIKDTSSRPAKVGKKWTDEDNEILKSMLKAGSPNKDIANRLQRTTGAISSRVNYIITIMAAKGSTPAEISSELNVQTAYISQFLQLNSEKVEDAKNKVDARVKSVDAKTNPVSEPPIGNKSLRALVPICTEIRDLLKVLVESLPAKEIKKDVNGAT